MINWLKNLIGRPVDNEQVWVQVTQEDIDSGDPCNPFSCPLSLAVRRTLTGRWAVTRTNVFLQGTNSPYAQYKFTNYLLPENAKQFVKDYDEGREVRPIIFTMEKNK